MRCLSVVGARPQFIKAWIVEAGLGARGYEIIGIHTGQHYEEKLSEVFFRELGIVRPYRNLEVGSASPGIQTARMLEGLEAVMLEVRPDWVIVYGDTNSTLAATIAASKLGLPVAHVEAGLRSFRRGMPEEQNRVVADHLAFALLAPSRRAMANLDREGLSWRATLVGDVMRDAFAAVRANVEADRICRKFGVQARKFILATVHRAENTDDAMRLCAILEGLSAAPLPVIFPVHPRTRDRLDGVRLPDNIIRVDPIGYKEMVALEISSERIATDSGGVQKEALWSGVPCVTLRNETEWVETVEAGWNCLVGTDPMRIAEALVAAPPDGTAPALYGGGDVTSKIAGALEREWS